MPELSFAVLGARALAHAASPQLALDIALRSAPGQRIESVLLRCAVRIETAARAHDANEQARLSGLFGPPEQWSRWARSLLWAQVTCVVPAFEERTQHELALPCSFDLAAAGSAYLQRLGDGSVPISVQFSGTVFHCGEHGLQAAPIPWSREAAYALPVALFQSVVDQHFPDSGVLALRRDLYHRLDRYRVEHGLPSWEQAVERLLEDSKAETKR